MLPFLQDDVARLHQVDLLREIEAHARANQLKNAADPSLRTRVGQLFLAAGAFLIESRSATPSVGLDSLS